MKKRQRDVLKWERKAYLYSGTHTNKDVMRRLAFLKRTCWWDKYCMRYLEGVEERLSYVYWRPVKWWALAKTLVMLDPPNLLALHYEKDRNLYFVHSFFKWLFWGEGYEKIQRQFYKDPDRGVEIKFFKIPEGNENPLGHLREFIRKVEVQGVPKGTYNCGSLYTNYRCRTCVLKDATSEKSKGYTEKVARMRSRRLQEIAECNKHTESEAKKKKGSQEKKSGARGNKG